MPWTIADVDKHKKGLTAKQKKQWVAAANTILQKCIANGGSDKTCAPKAIRQANSVVGNNMEIYAEVNALYEIRYETHQDKTHIVVPIVMMVEGVHVGSKGSILHLAEELGKIPDSWNGIPVVVNHPEEDGINISANSPGGIDQAVGRIYNAHMNGDKLMAEVWAEVDKLSSISPDAYDHILNQKPLEVSVGVFTEDEEEQGEYNNETYEAIATNYRPDHLALLPGGKGACSWDDGCGIRTNQKKGGKNYMVRNKTLSNKKVLDEDKSLNGSDNKLFEAMEVLNDNGYAFNMISMNDIEVNEDSYYELMEKVRQKLREKNSGNDYYYLEDMYKDFIIYEVGGKLFKQAYAIVEDEVEFLKEPVSVTKHIDISYTTNNNLIRTRFNNKKQEGIQMPNDNVKEPCGGCMEKIVTIIQSNKTPYTEDHREWLLTQEEAFLDQLIPKEPVKKKEPEKPAPQVNKEQAIDVLKESIKKPEDFFNLLPDEMKDSIKSGLTLHKEARQKMEKEIMNHTTDVWTEDELKEMNFETLRKIHGSLSIPVVDYSANGGTPAGNNSADMEILTMPGVELKG